MVGRQGKNRTFWIGSRIVVWIQVLLFLNELDYSIFMFQYVFFSVFVVADDVVKSFPSTMGDEWMGWELGGDNCLYICVFVCYV